MMNKYFVSYLFEHNETNGLGSGNAECTIDYKLDGIESIRKLSQSLERDFHISKVIILNFKKFDD